MCTVPLPPGVYPISIDKYIITIINGLPSADDRRICGFSRYSDGMNGKNINIPSTRGCLGLRCGAVASGTWRRVADPETSAASDLLTRRHTPERHLHFTHTVARSSDLPAILT